VYHDPNEYNVKRFGSKRTTLKLSKIEVVTLIQQGWAICTQKQSPLNGDSMASFCPLIKPYMELIAKKMMIDFDTWPP